MFMQKFSALSVLLLILSSGTAFASSSHLESESFSSNSVQLAQNRPGRGQRGQGIVEALNLTKDQQEQIQNIRQSYRSQIQPKQQTIQTVRQELNDLFAGSASAEQLRNKQQELGQLRQEVNRLNFESMLEVREILTSEQRQKFHDFMEQQGGDGPG